MLSSGRVVGDVAGPSATGVERAEKAVVVVGITSPLAFARKEGGGWENPALMGLGDVASRI